MQIRKASSNDAKIIAPLFNAYRMFYEQQSDLLAAEEFIIERFKKNESVIFKGFNNSTFGGLNFMVFWDSTMFLIFFPILIPFFEKRNKTTYFIKKPMLTALFLLIITITLMIVKKPYIEMINKIEILAYKSISE